MRNLTMLTDLYQLTMLQGYLKQGMQDRRAVFTMFFRHAPGLNYAIMAGNEQFLDYIENLHFGPEDIDYLRNLHLFDEDFLRYLKDFRFTGTIDIVPEGSFIFPGTPMVRVDAPLAQAQLIETALLTLLGHQSLIATKANRVVRSAEEDAVMEFGLRRAQGPDAGLYGARAAVIGGCDSTSNVLAGQTFGIKVAGTHAHSWVMSFESEVEAFRAYANCFPDNALLLVDTYDTLASGLPNAIKVFGEIRAKGGKPLGIRLDSGDLAYLSQEARKMLDEAGFPEVIICASNDLDETIIRDLKLQGARIDLWGVGTKLITSADRSAFGGVYKMNALETDGVLLPKLKRSDNPVKVTLPGHQELYRLYDQDGMAVADLITLSDEVIDEGEPLTIFDPQDTWKRMTLTRFTARKMLVPFVKDGVVVYEKPTLDQIRAHRKREEQTIWEQHLRLIFPTLFKVDWSHKLWKLRHDMLHDAQGRHI
ncbi:MAG: nicotinate phosphoribosyltransferase [Clostridiales bacterium]|nr:nicotinate phosphoribosyltransferase [Clostridiales bacterium]